jgi:hypothetical protein
LFDWLIFRASDGESASLSSSARARTSIPVLPSVATQIVASVPGQHVAFHGHRTGQFYAFFTNVVFNVLLFYYAFKLVFLNLHRVEEYNFAELL